jgi:hypothetical protein
MPTFIEIIVTDEEEGTKPTLINIGAIGRVYASPQNSKKSIVELSYHSINDAPVYLEADVPYEKLREDLMR